MKALILANKHDEQTDGCWCLSATGGCLFMALCMIMSCIGFSGYAQQADTSHQLSAKRAFINKMVNQAVNSVKCVPTPPSNGIPQRSEAPFDAYAGKILRTIHVVTFDFNRSFRDTCQWDHSLAARVGNRLHVPTRHFVIRNNIFLQSGQPLNAFKIADNERFIRSLEYIQDARIIVDTIPGSPDSVDITVYTKDFFSIAGGAAANGTTRINGNLYDANLAGMGQRLELMALYDHNRQPMWGYGALYRKNNVGGTFIDATLAYNTFSGSNYTGHEETVDYFQLERRLVSPYSRFAGGLVLSRNESFNRYGLAETDFYKYRFGLLDGWAGYSIGIRKLTATNNTIRDRRFLAVRYFNRSFSAVPTQIGDSYHHVYNSSQAALAEMTFFRQDYYKTSYIFGFGNTEDLPYGYNVTATVGLHQQLQLQRPYAGASATHYMATLDGDFMQVFARAGGFLHQGSIQDGALLVGANAYSRVMHLDRIIMRQFIGLNYARLYARTTTVPLRINNDYGPRGFLSDFPDGDERITLRLETSIYLPGKLLGFRLAPFPYADFTLINPANRDDGSFLPYASLGGGLRARNENLVFETIEARAYFFPDAPLGMKGFKVILNTNLRFRYQSNFITAPDFVRLNGQ